MRDKKGLEILTSTNWTKIKSEKRSKERLVVWSSSSPGPHRLVLSRQPNALHTHELATRNAMALLSCSWAYQAAVD